MYFASFNLPVAAEETPLNLNMTADWLPTHLCARSCPVLLLLTLKALIVLISLFYYTITIAL